MASLDLERAVVRATELLEQLEDGPLGEPAGVLQHAARAAIERLSHALHR